MERTDRKEWMRVRLQNMRSGPQRIMAKFLRRRGWVVFYLEEFSRDCKGLCWLNLYEQENKRREANEGD